jgi:hypothetical protein
MNRKSECTDVCFLQSELRIFICELWLHCLLDNITSKAPKCSFDSWDVQNNFNPKAKQAYTGNAEDYKESGHRVIILYAIKM